MSEPEPGRVRSRFAGKQSMLKKTLDRIYLRSTPACQRLLQRLYYVLNPRLSWRDRKKADATTLAFAERFFDSTERMEEYEAAFDASVVGPAIGKALQQLPEDALLYDAHKTECARLYALVREYEPETVVETGVYNGVSTLSILAALEANGTGRLYSVDYSRHLSGEAGDVDPATERDFSRGRPSCAEAGAQRLPPGREPGWIIPDRLRERWDLIPGKQQVELPPLLARLGSVDLFHHDSSHSICDIIFEFELAWQYLRSEGIVVSNHIGWNDAFETFAAEHSQDYGLMSWHYNPSRDYPCPGSSGYVVKSSSGIEPTGDGDTDRRVGQFPVQKSSTASDLSTER